jgi:hypothetical protein
MSTEIINKICPRCNRLIGNNEWTLDCKGRFVCYDNCDNLHPSYNRRQK